VVIGKIIAEKMKGSKKMKTRNIAFYFVLSSFSTGVFLFLAAV